MSDAPQQSYAILTRRGSPPWTCRASSPAHAFEQWLKAHPQRKLNMSFGPQKTVYSRRFARYTWTERVQSDAGHTVVVKGGAIVCPGDYVTPPSDFGGDAEVPPA